MTPILERTLRRIVKAPLVKWPALVAKLSSEDAVAISRALEEDAQRGLLLSEYMCFRASGTGHPSAHERAYAKLAKVRKALGYAYPKGAEVSW